jgi:hypothetical protein
MVAISRLQSLSARTNRPIGSLHLSNVSAAPRLFSVRIRSWELAMSDTRSCFVICPIGKAGTPTRDRTETLIDFIVAPALEPLGYGKPIRADELNEAGMITNQIVEHLANDDLVVADMTDFNANVFYELAARHVIEKPIVSLILSDQIDRIPFDVNQVRAIPYDLDVKSAERAKKKIAAQVETMDSDKPPENPLSRGFEVSALTRSDVPVEKALGELQASFDEFRSEVRAAIPSRIDWGNASIGQTVTLPSSSFGTTTQITPWTEVGRTFILGGDESQGVYLTERQLREVERAAQERFQRIKEEEMDRGAEEKNHQEERDEK